MLAADSSKLPKTIEMRALHDPDCAESQCSPILIVLDQRELPGSTSFLEISDWEDAVHAIKDMAVRGAPAIGIAGAAAMCLRSAELAREGIGQRPYLDMMQEAARAIGDARPTAISLNRAVERCLETVRIHAIEGIMPIEITMTLFELVNSMIGEDIRRNHEMACVGADLLHGPSNVVTHCNAGSLATAFFGTALGVIYEAADRGLIEMVYADETRPLGQGSRLTAWELSQAGVPVTLICDDMTASVMANGDIDAVFVGADRIAANGDVANKVGTLSVAILANHFGIPFYVVAPVETIDFDIPDGSQIPIEQRPASEVIAQPIEGLKVINPAFDVTPASLVTKVITERGAFDPSRLSALRSMA